MSRFLLALMLLAAAVSAQAITPSRQDADGTGGNCPQAEEIAQAENGAAAVEEPAPPAPAKTTAPPPQAKETAPLARPKSGARWHSFLPGMFK